MIIPDANLLLYAYGIDSPFHTKSKAWWAGCVSGREAVGLCHVTIFAFVRIATNGRILGRPMSVREAVGHVETWLAEPVVQYLDFGPTDVTTALSLIREIGTAGNLTTDAQIAAISLRYQAVIHSADSDFGRFRDVRWHNPLTRNKTR